MTDTFQSRIPALSDAELCRYLRHHQEYRTEAVEAALTEVARRDLAFPEQELAQIRMDLANRNATAQSHLEQSFVTHLGATPESRLHRVRQITAGILAIGFGAASVIYLTAAPKGANPLGYEPEDSKKYLRELEMFGGKVNVLATEFNRWWEGLWQGRHLASTVAWLTLFVALAFWLVAHRQARMARATDAKDEIHQSPQP